MIGATSAGNVGVDLTIISPSIFVAQNAVTPGFSFCGGIDFARTPYISAIAECPTSELSDTTVPSGRTNPDTACPSFSGSPVLGTTAEVFGLVGQRFPNPNFTGIFPPHFPPIVPPIIPPARPAASSIRPV